jgi:hypothetical protein
MVCLNKQVKELFKLAIKLYIVFWYLFGGVMVSALPSSVVDRGFESLLGQTKDYEIGICCYTTKHSA